MHIHDPVLLRTTDFDAIIFCVLLQVPRDIPVQHFSNPHKCWNLTYDCHRECPEIRYPRPTTHIVHLKCTTPTHDTGHVVNGCPSISGDLIKGVSAVELLHLNLDRYKEANRSHNLQTKMNFARNLEI